MTAADAAAADAAYSVGELVGAANIDWDGANTVFDLAADDDGDAVVSAEELDAYAADWNPANTADAAAAAQFIVDGIESDIADDRAYVVSVNDFNNADIDTAFAGKVLTDARLDALLAAAEQAVADDEAATALVDALDAANAGVADDVTANGTDAEVLAALRDALATALANADIANGTVVYATDPNNGDADVTTGSVITQISAALAGDADAQAAKIAYLASLDLTTSFDGSTEPANDEFNTLVDRAVLEAAVTTAQVAYAANGLAADLATAQDWVDYRDGLIADLEAATGFNDQLQAAADSQATADSAAAEALAAVEADHDLGVIGDSNAGEGNDVFVYDGETGGAIANFGVDGSDVIKFTAGTYTLVALAADETAADIAGSQTTKEIFVVDNGVSTTLYVETNAFDGNANGNGDIVAIELTGVTGLEASLTVSGYLSVA